MVTLVRRECSKPPFLGHRSKRKLLSESMFLLSRQRQMTKLRAMFGFRRNRVSLLHSSLVPPQLVLEPNLTVRRNAALELGAEYSMNPWIQALLDPEPVHPGATENISSPPAFKMAKNTRKNNANGTAESPKASSAESASTRARSLRSASPTKIATPGRKIASPRKPRAPKGNQRSATAREASNALQTAVAESASTIDGVSDKVKVGVETNVTVAENGEETTNTKVNVEMPKGHPDLPLPEDAEKMVETAKAMVEQAQKLDSNDGGKTSGKGAGKRGKRKAEDIAGAEEEFQASSTTRPEKKAKMSTQEFQKMKARSKALIGLTATIAVG